MIFELKLENKVKVLSIGAIPEAAGDQIPDFSTFMEWLSLKHQVISVITFGFNCHSKINGDNVFQAIFTVYFENNDMYYTQLFQ